jgi:aryl-alcohol dehydrogenase-like predicted oxidoreductase
VARVSSDIPTRPFGRTGERVSILGLGGWHLGVPKTDRAAVRLAHAAIDAGVTFLDNAWDYNDGLSETRMGQAIADRRDRVFLMTKVCTHGRGGKVAMKQLEQSLRRLRTDYLDLWQIHEVVYDDEPARHFARGGAVEALDRAKQQGKVRYVGFTGHRHRRCTSTCCRGASHGTRVSCRSTVSTRRFAASNEKCCRSSRRAASPRLG